MESDKKLLSISGAVALIVAFFLDYAILGAVNEINSLLYLSILLLYGLLLNDVKDKSTRSYVFFLLGVFFSITVSTRPDLIVSPITLVVWMTFLPFLYTGKKIWLMFLLINIVFVVFTLYNKVDFAAKINAVAFIAFQLFSLAATYSMITISKQKKEIEKTHFQLIAAQNLLEQQSKKTERTRIARDIHDGIGQRLIAISLKLEYAKHQNPENPGKFFEEVKVEVTETLNSLRLLVKEYRNQDISDLSLVIKELVEKLPGISCDIPKELKIDNPKLARELLFCLQEGLSNGVRHGNANRFLILTDENKEEDRIKIELKDNGSFKPGIKESKFGSGLTGIQERLEPFDGNVTLEKNNMGGASLILTIKLGKLEEALC